MSSTPLIKTAKLMNIYFLILFTGILRRNPIGRAVNYRGIPIWIFAILQLLHT